MRTMAGNVYLIGAGPGDPELLTLKAVRCLAEADVVLLDALVNRAVLRHVRAGVRVVDVGKRSGRCTTAQRFIDRLMLRYARRGLCVARVKGGDPYVFGRGGEEAKFLLDAGVHVEIVNGVSAGIAAPAVAGIALTNRGIADGVTFVTAHRADGTGPDWHALARTRTTLVVFMGVARLAQIAGDLENGGLSPATPAAIVECATCANERVTRCALGELAAVAEATGILAPAIVVIGPVAALALARSISRVTAALDPVFPRAA